MSLGIPAEAYRSGKVPNPPAVTYRSWRGDVGVADLEEANFRHDQSHGPLPDFVRKRVAPSWREERMTTGPLTDRKISQYQALGYYSAEFKAARKDLMRRKERAPKREGNFAIVDGRLIFQPE